MTMPHDHDTCIAQMAASFEESLDQALARAEAAESALLVLKRQVAAIYRGFESESLNGVVCSIPDTGLETRPHRLWCARCQRRYQKLKELADRPPEAA